MTKQEFLEEFNAVVEECEIFSFSTRDRQMQADALEVLKELMDELALEKGRGISAKDDDWANTVLGCECVAAGISHEIKMWLLIKQDLPDAAWNELISAQDAFRGALRAHHGFKHLGRKLDRLAAIENLVFPPQVFNSVGMIVHEQECSVCGGDYEACDHVKGRAYMGLFCNVLLKDFEIDHISIVDDPANKRCRITHFGVKGGMRNRMTWLVEPGEDSGTEEGLLTRAVIS